MKTSRNTHDHDSLTDADLARLNEQLKELSTVERIKWATDMFGNGLYAMTSAGVDSAVMLHLIARAQVPIPVVHLNTGFLPPETLTFLDELQKQYGFRLHEFGPTKEQIADIELLRLWDGDMDLYSKMTKLDPLSKAIKELGITALMVGVRGYQTANRASLGYVGRGSDGEIRVHPLIDWDKEQKEQYMQVHNLPRNPLYFQGYESVGDLHLTVPGEGRSGRTVLECGINVAGGKVVTRKKTEK